MKSIINYLNDVKMEAKNISWPTRKTTTIFTIGVITISLATIVYLGLLDFGFIKIVKTFLIK